MSEFTREHARAFVLSSILTTVALFGAAFFLIDWNRVREFFPPEPPAPIDQTDMIVAAETYVKTLPAYDASTQPSVIFDKTTVAGSGVSLVGFHSGLYRYVVIVQDGRIIGHEVHTTSADQQLTVFEPEPEAIRSRNTVLVRGQTATAGMPITVSIVDPDTEVTVVTQDLLSDSDGAFAVLLQPTQALTGRYTAVIVSETSTIHIPVIIDAQSNYGFGN